MADDAAMRVGISGYARVGKDEVAKVFEEHGFTRIGMSDALNGYLRVLNPIIIQDPDNGGTPIRYADVMREFGYVTAKARFPEVRRLLQVMGTEVGRAIDPDMWVKEMTKLADQHERTVTTGIRFPNELDAMNVHIHVTRHGYGPLNDHASEDLSDIAQHAHWHIENDGTIGDLRRKVTELIPLVMNRAE